MKNYLSILMVSVLFALSGCDNGNDNPVSEKIDILVCMHYYDDYYDIVGMLPDGTQKRYLFRGSESLEDPKQGSIGSDGVTLLIASDNDAGVYTYNLRTQTLTALTDPGDYEVPVFSPDMKKVYVFNDGGSEFIVIDVATKAVTVLDDENYLIYPSFMNDGQTMIVTYDWSTSIASIKTDGTGLTMLKEGDGDISYQHPLFVPALNKVVYVKRGHDQAGDYDYSRICLMNATGSGEAELTPGEVRYISPSISSDGRNLAFGRSSGNVVFVTTLNGTSIGTPQPITESEDNIWRPQFNRIDKAVFESLPEFVRPE